MLSLTGDRCFESCSLQRRVRCELEFSGANPIDRPDGGEPQFELRQGGCAMIDLPGELLAAVVQCDGSLVCRAERAPRYELVDFSRRG